MLVVRQEALELAVPAAHGDDDDLPHRRLRHDVVRVEHDRHPSDTEAVGCRRSSYPLPVAGAAPRSRHATTRTARAQAHRTTGASRVAISHPSVSVKKRSLPEMVERGLVTAATFEFETDDPDPNIGMSCLRVTVSPKGVTVHDVWARGELVCEVAWVDLRDVLRNREEDRVWTEEARLNAEAVKAFRHELECVVSFRRGTRRCRAWRQHDVGAVAAHACEARCDP